MKTIEEEINGQYISIRCPYCERKWSKKVILNKFTRCDNTRCKIFVYLDQSSCGDIFITFSVNPKELNAAAIQSNIMSRKIKSDLKSNDYHNTVN